MPRLKSSVVRARSVYLRARFDGGFKLHRIGPIKQFLRQRERRRGLGSQVRHELFYVGFEMSTAPIHGLAMDLGTTTIVIRLLNLETGEIIADSVV